MKAKPPYQLVLIDEEGRQMFSMETLELFNQDDLAVLNQAIKNRELDSEQEGGFWMFS